MNVLEELVTTIIFGICISESFRMLLTECNCKRFVTVLKVVFENLFNCLRFARTSRSFNKILCHKPNRF